MPTYDYRCNDCNYAFELVQKMSDDPISTCPSCNGNVKRLIGAGAGIIFKGTGWYQTDFKNSGSAPASKSAESKQPAAKSTDSSSSSDSSKKETSSSVAAAS